MNIKLEHILFIVFVLILAFAVLKWALPSLRAVVDAEELEHMQIIKAIKSLKSERDLLVRHVLQKKTIDTLNLNKEYELALEQLRQKGIKQLEAGYNIAEMDVKTRLVKNITGEILADLGRSDILEKCLAIFANDLKKQKR